MRIPDTLSLVGGTACFPLKEQKSAATCLLGKAGCAPGWATPALTSQLTHPRRVKEVGQAGPLSRPWEGASPSGGAGGPGSTLCGGAGGPLGSSSVT